MRSIAKAEPKKRLNAYKSNQIVYLGDAKIRRWDQLTSVQLRICMLSASKVKPEDTGETEYTISYEEFAQLCQLGANTDGGRAYLQLYEMADQLSHSGVNIELKNRDVIMFNWLDRVTVIHETGSIAYSLDPRLLPYYKTKAGAFTIVNVMDYMPLRGRYALLLFEFLSKWRNHGSVYQTMESLRQQLQVPADEYTPAEFKRNVIQAAVDEINEKTQYSFKVSFETKIGRRRVVEGIHFIIEPIQINLPVLSNALADKLAENGVSTPVATSLVREYSEKRILANVARAKEMEATGVMKKTLAALICDAIKKDYADAEIEETETPPAPITGKCSECGGSGTITNWTTSIASPCPKCHPSKPKPADEDPDAPWKLEGIAKDLAMALADEKSLHKRR